MSSKNNFGYILYYCCLALESIHRVALVLLCAHQRERECVRGREREEIKRDRDIIISPQAPIPVVVHV